MSVILPINGPKLVVLINHLSSQYEVVIEILISGDEKCVLYERLCITYFNKVQTCYVF